MVRIFTLSIATLALAAGCGDQPSSDGGNASRLAAPRFADDAVNVDRGFSDDVTALDDQLVIATAGHAETLAKIHVGSLVAGDRARVGMSADSPNPYGFLRRVTAIRTDGAKTILMTNHAELSEWLTDGDLELAGGRSLFGSSSVRTRSKDATEGTATISIPFEAALDDNVKIENGHFDVQAGFDGYFRGQESPIGAAFRSRLTLSPTLTADLTVTFSGSKSSTKTWDGPNVMVPIPAPLPITVRFTPQLTCTVTAAGTVSASVTATVGAKVVAGFEGTASMSALDVSNLSETPSATGSIALKSHQGVATLDAECQLLLLPTVLAFDTVGIQGKVGAFVHLHGEVCATTSTAAMKLTEEHGFLGDLSARIQIPIVNKGKDYPLTSFRRAVGDPIDLVGHADGCAAPPAPPSVDSCAGKADGFYCSEVTSYGGIVCSGGQVLKGLQCDPSQKCTGGTADAIECT